MKNKITGRPITYWWDFGDEDDEIIVESNDPRFPVVARFKYDPNVEHGLPDSVAAIDRAEKYIEDLNAGIKTPVSV